MARSKPLLGGWHSMPRSERRISRASRRGNCLTAGVPALVPAMETELAPGGGWGRLSCRKYKALQREVCVALIIGKHVAHGWRRGDSYVIEHGESAPMVSTAQSLGANLQCRTRRRYHRYRLLAHSSYPSVFNINRPSGARTHSLPAIQSPRSILHSMALTLYPVTR